ncbi:MAG: hypothetical protein JXA20_16670 [Spirochaetes bacterium]|nr:hypothetical protein [Spirochaetota bacterium]
MKFLRYMSLAALAITIAISPLWAREGREQEHIMALGIDYNLNRGEHSCIPILYYDYLHCFPDSPWYVEGGFENSVTAFVTLAMDTDRFHAGFGPVFEYLIQAGSNYYVDGNSLEHLMIMGNDIGLRLFFEYKWMRHLTTGVTWHPKYYFYTLFSGDDNGGLWIDPPNSHIEQEVLIEVKYKDIEERNFGTLKHGFLARGRCSFAYRQGYGTFYDLQLNRGRFFTITRSDTDRTWKIYCDLGFYYIFKHDFNLQIDLLGSYQYRVDRNNAEQIGTWFADHAIMPGYHNYEFGHDQYLAGRVAMGIPIPFWSTQIKPGYNILYMSDGNGVIGIDDYPRSVYTSVSCEFFTMIGDTVPVWLKYAYGIEARRRGSFSGRLHRGNHELTLYFGVAF